MRKLKKATNLLIMIGALLTALSGVINTGMNIVSNFTKEEEKKEVPAPAPVFEQRVAHGSRGVHISKTVDIPAEAPVAEVTMTAAPVKSNNTLWWIGVTVVGLAVAAANWLIHRRMHRSTEDRKR
jgi:hypothetical protein